MPVKSASLGARYEHVVKDKGARRGGAADEGAPGAPSKGGGAAGWPDAALLRAWKEDTFAQALFKIS